MKWRFAAAITALVFFAAAFATRAGTSLWYDELFTFWVATQPWADIAAQANADGFTPPLFYFLVKALLALGVHAEDLRALPIAFAALAVLAAWDACWRLFGPSSRTFSLLGVGGSAYLFTFAHELRPYSVLISLTFVVLGRLGGERSSRSDAQAAGAALAATLFSYLGVSLVAIWCWEARRRVSTLRFWSLIAAALLISLPGLAKAVHLAAAWPGASIGFDQTPPRLSGLLFGLASAPLREGVLWFLTALAGMAAIRKARTVPAVLILFRALACSLASVVLLDAVVRTGFAPRYFAVVWSVAALIGVGLVSGAGRGGAGVSLVLMATNLMAIQGYIGATPPAREDWRGAMARLQSRVGPRGTLLSFPYHHGAVAAYAYAPGLQIGGGFTSRQSPVFWYDPPAPFTGYGFAGLTRFDTADGALSRLAARPNVCLISDEPDITKTATVFAAFERLGAEPFHTGDPRLRAVCR